MRRVYGGLVVAGLVAAAAFAATAEPSSPADAIAEKFANADKPKPQTVAESERPSLDYEIDMLRRARLEAEERKSAPQVQPADAPLPAAELQPIKVDPPAPIPEPATIPTAAPTPTPVAAPAPDQTPPVQPSSTSTAAAEPAPQATATAPVAAPAASARATILLILEGARSKIAPDPIVCFADVCAISSGLSEPARTLPRAQALAMGSTRDATLDPCYGKSACAFRDVPLPDDAILQVISLGAGEPPKAGDGFTADLDKTCKIEDRDLSCGHPLATLNFTAWVVPEATAVAAGAPVLEAAIADGLPFADGILSADK